ncbi:unnamed protein product [Thelazia callipaeda]|uniref:Ras-associating domain-containing protein n=1 Tax=Thelazia callipaeda TaxID=103827 RepID=A0A0N5D5S5_THECL|nr:unnamed protein product [Thelazia callipaeda]
MTENVYRIKSASGESSLDRAIAQCSIIAENKYFSEGILLKCVDAKPLYLYLHYALFTNPDHELRTAQIDQAIRDLHLRPKSLFGAYDEICVIQKVSSSENSKLPSHRHAGFIVILFKLLDDQTKHDRLEKSWLSWSGAREIYKYSPRSWNLRKIALHKFPKEIKTNHKPFAYVLLCEFGSILNPSNRLEALNMVERLRVRNCGYISLYQIQWSYGRTCSPSQASTNMHRSATSATRSDRNQMMRAFSQEVEIL